MLRIFHLSEKKVKPSLPSAKNEIPVASQYGNLNSIKLYTLSKSALLPLAISNIEKGIMGSSYGYLFCFGKTEYFYGLYNYQV